jgi:hypothetical protein
MYRLDLIYDNGKVHMYGTGDMAYMMELINDYLVTNNMYEQDEISFKVSKINI